MGVVRAALAEGGIGPGRLELEITEGVLIDSAEEAAATRDELRAQGVQVALDDFGTGYSSLGYLRQFSLDKLKVDRSFTRELTVDAGQRAIVRAVLDLGRGRGRGMETCAEGGEIEEQRALLAAEGCTEAQGFLFGRPQPVPEDPSAIDAIAAE